MTTPTGAPTPPSRPATPAAGRPTAGPPAPSSGERATGPPPAKPVEPASPNGPAAGEPPVVPGGSSDSGSGDPSLAANKAGIRRALSDAGNVSERQKLADSAGDALYVGNLMQGGTTVHGDSVGQIYHFNGTGIDAPVRPGLLPRRLDEAARWAYAGHKELLKSLEPYADRRALIMCAPAGRGKLTAAIRLLQQRQVDRILMLRADESLERLEKLELRTGYILCDPTSSGGVSAHAINTVNPLLDQHDCHLVIIMSDEALLSEEDLLDLTVPLPPPPTHAEALGEHLHWRLPEQAAPLLADERFTTLVAGLLLPEAPLRHVGDLAQVIADVHRDLGRVDFAEVQRLVDRRADQAFAIWFDQLDPENRLHAIALAVLNGLPSEFVMESMRSLRRRLEPSGPGLVTGGSSGNGNGTQVTFRAAPDPFRVSRQERLVALHAVAENESVRGSHGVTRAQVLRYTDRTYATRVIRRAWSEYAAQRVLLDWLSELVVHPADPVRIWAATAVGILAIDSFEYVSRAVLDPWAHSNSPRRRAAVAHALHMPAEDARVRPIIRRMVTDWLDAPSIGEGGDFDVDDPEPDRRAQATAARAYGYSLGRSEPDEAMAAFHGLALADDIRIAVAIGESLSELLLHDSDLLAEPILAMILQWLPDPDREGTAHLVFLIMATNLLTDMPAGESGEPARSWPLLLWLAKERPALRFGLAAIWHHLLSQSQYLPQQAEEVLHQWARYVEPDEQGCATLAGMLRTAAENDPYLCAYLLSEFDRWTDNDMRSPTPHAAYAAYTALNDQGAGQ